ncbi:hypothetical protein QMN51_14240, partial [Escherichia coli]|nr:hypothetical protein [Escherichia coli]
MLTVKQIEAAKPKEKPYRLLDGGNDSNL